MLFSSIFGNEEVKKQLIKNLEKKTLPNCLLFTGPDGIGKALFAKEMAKSLLEANYQKEHPDLHIYQPEGKSFFYKIETIRELIEEAYKPPFSAPKKVFILEEAEKMHASSSNALLKTLEEPTLDAYFILITSHFSQILPTIVSRMTHFYFLALSEKEIEKALKEVYKIPPKEAEEAAKLAQGSFKKALEIASFEGSLSIKELFFSLFQKKFGSFEEFSQIIEKIQTKITEAKEPVKALEQFFSYLNLWYKDLLFLKEGVPFEKLYFSELKEENIEEIFLPPPPQVKKWVEKALVLFERGTKVFECLEYISIQFKLI